MRAQKDGWLHTLFIDLVIDAWTKFGGDLLAYADYVEGEFAWWGHFEWVVLGIVSRCTCCMEASALRTESSWSKS